MVKRIALFIPLSNGFNAEVLGGVVEFAQTAQNWAFHQFDAQANHLGALAEWQPDGIITAIPDRNVAIELEAMSIPLVNVSNVQAAPGLPYVANDNEAIGILGAQHFLERGFRRCGFIGWPFQHFAIEREQAFRRTVTNAGADCLSYSPGPNADRLGWYDHRTVSDRSMLGC